MPLFKSPGPSIELGATTRVIVAKEPRMEEKAIQKALAGNAGAPWYQAIVAKIEVYRDAALDNGAVAVKSGNDRAMAAALGVHTAFTEFLADLDASVNAVRPE